MFYSRVYKYATARFEVRDFVFSSTLSRVFISDATSSEVRTIFAFQWIFRYLHLTFLLLISSLIFILINNFSYIIKILHSTSFAVFLLLHYASQALYFPHRSRIDHSILTQQIFHFRHSISFSLPLSDLPHRRRGDRLPITATVTHLSNSGYLGPPSLANSASDCRSHACLPPRRLFCAPRTTAAVLHPDKPLPRTTGAEAQFSHGILDVLATVTCQRLFRLPCLPACENTEMEKVPFGKSYGPLARELCRTLADPSA